jgi:hypothetical protein
MEKVSCMGNALLRVWKEMVLGSALWLSAVLLQIWIPRSITLAIATFGTALWLVSIVNICILSGLKGLMQNKYSNVILLFSVTVAFGMLLAISAIV